MKLFVGKVALVVLVLALSPHFSCLASSYNSESGELDDGGGGGEDGDGGGSDIVKCVCDGSCEHLRAEECQHGVTFDMCHCCLVCSRGENEPCGGARGTCAFGLHCQLNEYYDEKRSNSSSTPLLAQEGTCSRVGRCGQVVDQYGCVVDPEGQCICLTRKGCPGEKMFLFEDESSCRSRMAFLIAKKDLEPATATPPTTATGQ
ncbi:Insulin-like growth factor-binding protein 7 [Orchesella cincta]|uniref:Insulin-like growth factor-binding protein 7 n=1 Tax=Orchesella cincta TaxID=48709 RepID=A0A1D2N2M8_ORCCI|nr:Insulin-like growth factor-binding protein 7 [Orchesella cincta]